MNEWKRLLRRDGRQSPQSSRMRRHVTVRVQVRRDDRPDLARGKFVGNCEDVDGAIARACKAAGVPVFSPHDLRHRRATLWHLQGVPIADAGAWLGHSPSEHLATYAHATLVDRDELKYADLLGRDRTVLSSVLSSTSENVR
jgi:integrase